MTRPRGQARKAARLLARIADDQKMDEELIAAWSWALAFGVIPTTLVTRRQLSKPYPSKPRKEPK